MKFIIPILLSLFLWSCSASRQNNFNQRKYFKHRLKSKPTKTTASNSTPENTKPFQLTSQTEAAQPNTTETVELNKTEVLDTLSLQNIPSPPVSTPPTLSAIPEQDSVKKTSEITPIVSKKYPIQPKLKSKSKTESPISKERRTFNTLFLMALFSFFGAWFVLILPVYLSVFSGVLLISIGLVFIAWLLSIITLIQSKKVPQKDRDSLFRTQKFLLWLATIGIAVTFGLGFLLLLTL